jgi:hypothetical protein
MAGVENMQEAFKKLVAEGESFRQDFLNGYRYRWYSYSPLHAGYARWKKECLVAVRQAFGAQSRYYTELASVENDYASRAPNSVFTFFLNTMKKAQGEVKPPPAQERASSAAGLMEDFLARAEGLVQKGHFISAATLAGAVLEDALRRLCELNDIFCAENSTLENVNDKLLQAGVYDAAWHRETALRISLKRTAELCYTDKITERNVLDMVGWLRGFMLAHFRALPKDASSAGRTARP